MLCHEFEAKLSDFVAGRLTGETVRHAQRHLESCSRCANLLQTVLGEGEPLPQFFVRDLLHKTCGSTCGSARRRLPALLDGEADSANAQLLEQHLQHCRACQSLRLALQRLNDVLPQLAESRVDPAFTRAVLAATRPPALLKRQSRWKETWQRLVTRPRFAWELAYVATILTVLLCGSPRAPLGKLPPQALAIIQVQPERGIRSLQELAEASQQATRQWGGKAWEVGTSKIGVRRPKAKQAWMQTREHLEELGRATKEGNLGEVSLILTELGKDLNSLWHGMRSDAADTNLEVDHND